MVLRSHPPSTRESLLETQQKRAVVATAMTVLVILGTVAVATGLRAPLCSRLAHLP